MKLLRFEYERLKKIIIPFMCTTGGLQLLFLYFFALVGRLDSSERDGILGDYNAVLGLATTGTMCVLAICGSVLAGPSLVRDYIGMSKSKTFSLPIGRGRLFLTRILSFSLVLAGAELFGLLLANLVFGTVSLWLPITVNQPFNDVINTFAAIFTCIGLTLTIVLLSSYIGIRLNSTARVIVASIVLVVLLSNLSALALISSMSLSAIFSLVLVVGIVILSLEMSRRIENSEAL